MAPDLGLRLFTDAELFGFRKPRHPDRRRRRVAFASALLDLKPGDLVVHEDHGIARFERFATKEVAGVEREYLELAFAGTDRLSLPTERIDKITRFVGGTPPALSKLGRDTDWLKTKGKVKKAVLEIARELVKIYATREVVPGHPFAKDSPWQIELENAFPYTETPDQLQAIEEVKRDMERPRPMDRLIVGDVGYGKTEVALRAAFKAVMDGMQVAILVPTTVLAQQHFQTFGERLATFPIRVEMLSRFRSPAEQKEVLASIETGEVDVVIGTHRLLQSDVKFRKLGLLVIDEEHRFGVRHKERLKQLRTEVDVLSMTATPIPRTLHMALSGVRDISVIETPPENRQPIETKIIEYADDIVREAILRELDRGGQIYFVHNRVQGIEHVRQRLERMVSNARYAVAHGQMDEDRLERVMTEFARGDYDVLVCTTIIESGLDIPNVNTIVINRAGSFGLAQLYQLRGRVGRSAEKAFAYLLYNKQERLTVQARQRLQALFEASELGSGFRIAMHDLEIRGAGNLLGAEQHGHVAAVGFELYTQLLQEAIEEIKGEPSPKREELPSVTIDLALPTAIPDSYVPSRARKLELYRRIANIRQVEELRELSAELRDRYGTPPEPVRNLLFGVEVKLRAIGAGVTDLRARKGELRLVVGRDIRLDQRRKIENAFPKLVVGHRQVRGALPPKSDWRDALTRVLGELAA
ncbi:MAG: transcription-repair coupling factor [Chloroflexi bacterium 13_1_40CM_4_68_4]|nr:MAG: transcription-repair coupling factor [Chloroflexi bacterium 13_1_40CM_4_68_4]